MVCSSTCPVMSSCLRIAPWFLKSTSAGACTCTLCWLAVITAKQIFVKKYRTMVIIISKSRFGSISIDRIRTTSSFSTFCLTEVVIIDPCVLCWLFSCTAPMQQFVSQLCRLLITRCMGNIEMILNKITLRENGLSRIIAIKSGKLIYCVYYSNSFPGAKLKKLVQFLYVTRQRSVKNQTLGFSAVSKIVWRPSPPRSNQGSPRIWFCVDENCFSFQTIVLPLTKN